MHFALPPRKTSQPPPYLRASRHPPQYGKHGLRLGGYLVCGVLSIYLLFHYASFLWASTEPIPPDTPSVVIVTVFDEQHLSDDYIQIIKANREDYARRHGYQNFFTSAANYTRFIHHAPKSWTLVPALRHALSMYPHTSHFFSLSPHAVIMSPSLSLHEHILAPSRLESLMQKDIPVVPPDSVIHTFGHLKEDKVDLVLTKDGESLSHESLILRQGEWAKFFLDTWFNPLYRAYSFQKAEGHALEHAVQWHPTILAKLALVPQRVMNSYNFNMTLSDGQGNEQPLDSMFQTGDFLVRFHHCGTSPERDCEKEIQAYVRRWEDEVERLDGNQS